MNTTQQNRSVQRQPHRPTCCLSPARMSDTAMNPHFYRQHRNQHRPQSQ